MSHFSPCCRSGVVMCACRRHSACHQAVFTLRWSGSGASGDASTGTRRASARKTSGVSLPSVATASPARGGCVVQRWDPACGAGLLFRPGGEVEFVFVVGVDQIVFHLGFAIGDLCHEVVVLGLA